MLIIFRDVVRVYIVPFGFVCFYIHLGDVMAKQKRRNDSTSLYVNSLNENQERESARSNNIINIGCSCSFIFPRAEHNTQPFSLNYMLRSVEIFFTRKRRR